MVVLHKREMKSLGFFVCLCCILILVLFNPPLVDDFGAGRLLVKGGDAKDCKDDMISGKSLPSPLGARFGRRLLQAGRADDRTPKIGSPSGNVGGHF